MAKFEPVTEATQQFGNNSYMEVARKRLVEENGNTSEFLVITRGFYDKDGGKRWTKFVTLPDSDDLKGWLSDAVRKT
jgi:hypothetical protein